MKFNKFYKKILWRLIKDKTDKTDKISRKKSDKCDLL